MLSTPNRRAALFRRAFAARPVRGARFPAAVRARWDRIGRILNTSFSAWRASVKSCRSRWRRARPIQLSICRSLRCFSMEPRMACASAFSGSISRISCSFSSASGISSCSTRVRAAFQQLPDLLLPRGLIDLHAQQRDLRVDVSLGLELGQDLGGELAVAFRESLLGALDARLNLCRNRSARFG